MQKLRYSVGSICLWEEGFVGKEGPICGELCRDERNWGRKYREFVKGMMRFKEAMRGGMERRGIYGNEVFAGKLKEAYKIEEMIKPTGRPKKEPK